MATALKASAQVAVIRPTPAVGMFVDDVVWPVEEAEVVEVVLRIMEVMEDAEEVVSALVEVLLGVIMLSEDIPVVEVESVEAVVMDVAESVGAEVVLEAAEVLSVEVKAAPP